MRPVRLALVDDYEVVLLGVRHMLDAYRDRIEVVELDAREPVSTDVDIALYDTFAQPEADRQDIEVLLANPHAARVAVYTWCFEPHVVDAAIRKGAHGYLSKRLPAADLVAALEAINAGELVVSSATTGARVRTARDWPGRAEGLTDRESEIIALITQGHSNAAIADRTFLSINSIKTYIRGAYRKMRVSSRTQAVLWGVEHGFKPEYHQIDSWRT